MNYRIVIVCMGILVLVGCSVPDFDSDGAKGLIEQSQVVLSNEQVTLNDSQVTCGAQKELWDLPNGNVARLEQKGRDLGFTDDVRLNDPEVHWPYIQVSGKYSVQVTEAPKLRDTPGGKLADAHVSVVVPHECFTSALPLMGIRKGKFSVDTPPVFRFTGSGKEFQFDRLIHP